MSTTYSQQFAAPANLNTAHLTGSNPGQYGQTRTPLSTTAQQQQMMVHTPYSCEHDLVPSNCEVASQCFGSSAPKDGTEYGMEAAMSTYSATGSFANNASRRSNASSPQPARMHTAPSFDPWTGQYEGEMTTSSSYSNHQSPSHIVARPRGDSRHSASSGSSSGYNTQTSQGQYATGNQTSAHMQGVAPAGNFPAFTMRAPILNTPVHASYLGGKVEYLEMPQGQAAEISTAAQWNRSHKVFIGHVKFEINADGLRWMIYMLTGVQAGKVEVRGMGCFMVFFASAEDVFRVRGLHKRVIFDTQGIWFAQDSTQEQVLHHYATNVAPSVHAKLPKGLMVVDEETSRRRTRKHKTPANNKQQAAFTSAEEQHQQVVPQQSTPIVAGGFATHADIVSHQDADQLWAAGHQFHSGSRINSQEDEYCS
jgi:hypothetical protein